MARLWPWLVVALAVSCVGYAVLPATSPIRPMLGYGVAIGSAVLAAIACASTAGRSPRLLARVPWLFFASAALAFAASEVALLAGWNEAGESFLVELLFVAGAGSALWPRRSRGQEAELVLDATLILAASIIVLERIAVWTDAGAGAPHTTDLLDLAGGFVAVAPLVCAGLLVLWGEPVIAGRSVPAVAGAAVMLFVGEALAAAPATIGWSELAWGWAWGLLAVAAGRTRGLPRSAVALEEGTRTRRCLRHAIVPTAALFLGWVGLEAAISTEPDLFLAAMSGVLGLLLAARIALALHAVERQSEERRKLAQSRALVEVSRALAGATQLDRTLELVSEWACRLLDARAAGIELLLDDGKTLEMRAVYGMRPDVKGMRFPVDESFTGWVVQHLRPRAAASPRNDPYMHPASVELLGNDPTAAAPLAFGDKRLGVLFAIRPDRLFGASDLELLGALADQAALAIENARLFEQVHALSLTDPLTGLANRRQLERDLARELAAARRGRQLVLVLFDLDNFKDYNDRHGHLAGDEVLRTFGHVLAQSTRAMNLAARYGGDEFLVLLTDTPPDGARVFADRVAASFQEALRDLPHSPEITVSAGIASFHPGMTGPEELIAAADAGLYRVKADRSVRSGG